MAGCEGGRTKGCGQVQADITQFQTRNKLRDSAFLPYLSEVARPEHLVHEAQWLRPGHLETHGSHGSYERLLRNKDTQG